jgi:hypothetical protein
MRARRLLPERGGAGREFLDILFQDYNQCWRHDDDGVWHGSVWFGFPRRRSAPEGGAGARIAFVAGRVEVAGWRRAWGTPTLPAAGHKI